MKLVYIVNLGYQQFVFAGGSDALQFARTAALTRKEHDRIDIRVEDSEVLAAEEDAYNEFIEKEPTAQEQREQDYLFTDEV